MKKIWLLLLILAHTALLLTPLKANESANGVPYQTFAEDYKRRMIPTQDAYIPYNTYTSFLGYTLNGPEDILLKGDYMYIADTGNKRILKVEKNLTSVEEIGLGILKRPTGVYVDDNLSVYVADFEASLVYVFDALGTLIQTIEKPTAPMFGQNTPYRPYKIDGDVGGNLYIVSEGSYQGIIQLDHVGNFLGFFGANPVKVDLRAVIFKMILSDDVVNNFIKITPQTMSNIAIDPQNRVYTVTRGTNGNSIKRLNISGINRLPRNLNDSAFSNAIAIGPIGNIYTVSDDGFIREYDQEGNLLFMFGGKDSRTYQRGLFNTPVGIVVDDQYNLYVLDRAKNELQVFMPTAFSNIVHEAVDLYQKGFYLDSKAPWEEVLSVNAMFDLAYKGIGHAYYKAEMYEEALDAYALAGYKQGYSDAYWEIRNAWLMDHLSWIFIGAMVAYSVFMVYKFTFAEQVATKWAVYQRKIYKVKLFYDLAFLKHMLKKPLDGFQEIKRYDRIGILSATVLYGVLFLERLFAIFYEGGAFNTHELATFSLANEFIAFMGPIVLFIIANYLVCAVSNGEGRFKDVYKATIFALAPLMLFWPIVVIISRYLTLNEAFIYEASMSILILWSSILMFFMIKDIHNYGVLETIKIILITAFTIVMMVVGFTLLTGLANQLWNFIIEITREVILRG
ncbi:YIP1 family protein [Acholeplasma manati]|uniref:YIP1 family protein n=1 Tax=Paracholeplasma manati TaxID=591373 RepID=A0ABT2Y4Y8_9MOLU|nr:YIP1 family protein [Paracholeplasma manati]MCV2231527.1 YIP1 family protein [Paracholeplasma manati]